MGITLAVHGACSVELQKAACRWSLRVELKKAAEVRHETMPPTLEIWPTALWIWGPYGSR
jgi:hypothetical protein